MAIQLEDFAKQVLFGKTMEEKLSFPREEIVDTVRGSAIKTPKVLSRPSHLVLREEGVKASHPSQARLVDEKERGRLLHFFGNHELLATELMALAILKFPDAPASFRQGLLDTLKDEQIHTQLYIHRMKQCGVEFGELPLSDYFWRSVSSMEDPLDYVTRLSLTFEQANLDYSREYGKIFETVGDRSTAGILDKIYRDEIDHVGFGLKWFRRWKAEGKTDWEAFRERLVFPLSPARAKGNFFNAAGRSEAGLDVSFIKELEVFSQSRGRTPSVFWFNPEAERYAAANAAEPLGGAGSVVQDDLAFLPAYLSKRDDILLMRMAPSSEFLSSVQAAGVELPEVFVHDDSASRKAPLMDRKIGELKPWAWTPDSLEYFSDSLSEVTRPPAVDSLWNDSIRELHSKAWGAKWASEMLSEQPSKDWIAPSDVFGEVARNLDELVAARESFATLGYRSIACKAPFGTAANGMRCLLEGEVLGDALHSWLEKVWAEQGSVVVEPWLPRVYDFSVQLEMRSEGLKVQGYTRLLNNARGQFRGIVTNGFCLGLDAELVKFIMRRVEGRPRLYHWYEQELVPKLEAVLRSVGFSGPIGVDAFIFRDLEGKLRLKPVVELNPRYTMGRVAWEIGQRNAATSVGFFQILNRSQIKKSGAVGFSGYSETMKAENPLSFSNEKVPRIVSGSFPLNDPSQSKQFLAMYHVRDRFSKLPL